MVLSERHRELTRDGSFQLHPRSLVLFTQDDVQILCGIPDWLLLLLLCSKLVGLLLYLLLLNSFALFSLPLLRNGKRDSFLLLRCYNTHAFSMICLAENGVTYVDCERAYLSRCLVDDLDTGRRSELALLRR